MPVKIGLLGRLQTRDSWLRASHVSLQDLRFKLFECITFGGRVYLEQVVDWDEFQW